MGVKIHLRITEDLRKRIRKAHFILFFLDYDGTLVPIRKAPHLAVLKKSTRNLLKTLSSKKWSRIFIVSGRTLRNVRRLVNLKPLSYVGNHGFELDDPRLVFINKKAEASKKYIARIYSALKKSLKIKGV
ncbi:MAG: HAD-IIB family hydrolase, partial [Candidatus Omnitrophica bacterium]|nr:HAD-IIB family hydrolase [Candidatus Omnitrophota bacterium]